MTDSKQLLTPHMIAFIDVMGSKEISKDETKKHELLELLLGVHQEEQKEGFFRRIEEQNGGECAATVTSFSDSIVISLPLCKDLQNGIHWDLALSLIKQHVYRLFSRALASNFLVRGAIEVGELYHSNKMVFGQSLVDAVLNEQKAIYPRVILTDHCLAARKQYCFSVPEHNYVSDLNFLDFNNPEPASFPGYYSSADVFIDYDGTACVRMVNTHLWHDESDPLIDFKKRIDKGIMDYGDNSYLKKNWIWLKHYIERETHCLQQYKKFLGN